MVAYMEESIRTLDLVEPMRMLPRCWPLLRELSCEVLLPACHMDFRLGKGQTLVVRCFTLCIL